MSGEMPKSIRANVRHAAKVTLLLLLLLRF